jgi:formylglycine-generating enzyme required for sulfatase activity
MRRKICLSIVCVILLVLVVSPYVAAQEPTIVIYEPVDGAEVQSQTIDLLAMVKSPGEHPLKYVAVLVNGGPVSWPGKESIQAGPIATEIQLEEGENWIIVIAANDLGMAQQAITVTYTPSPVQGPTDVPTPGIGSTKINPIDGAEMVYVPAGEFTMGSSDDDPDADDDEKPQHKVYLDAFWIYKTEVTNAQYRQCVEAGACTPPHVTEYYDDPAYADHPVVWVDWYQVEAYSEWAWGRLPTEAEWEKAARGTDGRIYPWENDFDGNRLNFCDSNCSYEDTKDDSYDDGYTYTAPVGSYPAGASPYGALDMAGNVWEWTSTLYEEYPYRADDGREDVEADGARVLRGGSFYDDEWLVRCAFRYRDFPRDWDYRLGFRVVVSPSTSEP